MAPQVHPRLSESTVALLQTQPVNSVQRNNHRNGNMTTLCGQNRAFPMLKQLEYIRSYAVLNRGVLQG